jgi:signal transduction histidine kinase
MEFPFTTAKGRKLWVRAMGHPQVGMNGKITSVIGNIMDITERKRAEDELREAKEQAEAATKLKDKFVELVAHDLRSPFTAMMGLLRLFGERKSLLTSEDDKQILDRIFKSGDRMMAMIDQLLKISRLQTGKITPQPRFFKGYMAVAATIGSLSHNAAQKGIAITNDIPVDMRFYADPTLFDEVLGNLLSNAIKFCSKGDKITFFVPPGSNSAIAIRDTGKGIDDKRIPDLFRDEVTTTTLGTAGEMGTGLGLPFSHDIMEAHGGELTVESAPGKGSVFCAKLPHVTPLALVVDDDPDMLLILRIHLEKIGADVIEALDGEKALSAMKDRLPHIVITDIMMPGMDGFTLLDRIKQNSQTSGIPVIVITSADGEIRGDAFRHGADDFVSKPIDPQDFIPRVRRFVG